MLDLVLFSIFSLSVSFLATTVSNTIALYPFLKSSNKHWTEKARRAFPARLTAIINPFLLAACFGAYGWLSYTSSPLSYLFVGAASAYVAGLIFWVYVERRILNRKLKISDLIKSHICIWFLFYYPVWILIFLLLLPSKLTSEGFFLYGVIFFMYCFLALGGSFMIAKFLGLAESGSPRLEKLIKEASKEIGVAPRRVYQISWVMVNALVYPLTKMLVVSKAAMNTLNDEELKAILKHELGHISEPFSIILVRMTGLFFLFMLFSMKQIYGTYGIVTVVFTLLTAFLGITFLNYLAQKMEKRADVVAKTGDNGTYAKTLEKVYRLNMLPAVNNNRKSPHPDLYDRMKDAGVSPDYLRPKPPSRFLTSIALLVSLLIFSIFTLISEVL